MAAPSRPAFTRSSLLPRRFENNGDTSPNGTARRPYGRIHNYIPNRRIVRRRAFFPPCDHSFAVADAIRPDTPGSAAVLPVDGNAAPTERGPPPALCAAGARAVLRPLRKFGGKEK